MEKNNIKLTILVDGKQAYFGAPVFYSIVPSPEGDILSVTTEIGNVTKQRLEVTFKKPTYIEPVIIDKEPESKPDE